MIAKPGEHYGSQLLILKREKYLFRNNFGDDFCQNLGISVAILEFPIISAIISGFWWRVRHFGGDLGISVAIWGFRLQFRYFGGDLGTSDCDLEISVLI